MALPERIVGRGAPGGASKKDASATGPVCFDSWPVELDGYLRQALSTPGCEQEAISTILAARPELSEDLIWSRIVYLGLTRRKRRPYRRHQWTAREDQILKEEYGRDRAGSTSAIAKILQLHPGWSRDAIVWRARVLGLTRHQASSRQVWSAARDHCLLSLMGCQLETIAQRMNCSTKAVLARLRRLGRSADFFGGFKTKDLVLDLHISEVSFNSWVRRGWLQRKKGRITEESLRWFCRHHADEIPFETLPVETQKWLTLSMDYGRGSTVRRGGRRKNPKPETDPSARPRTAVGHWMTKSSAS